MNVTYRKHVLEKSSELSAKHNPQIVVQNIINRILTKYGIESEVIDDVIDALYEIDYPALVQRQRVLEKFFSGEWVDTADIETHLGIPFKLGYKLFEFSRTAEWNEAPLNGQRVTTQFRLKK